MTPDEYNAQLLTQSGRCAICQKVDKLVVDHDHTTNAIRGLLCYGCNTALGLFQDNVDTLRRAISYLAKFKQFEKHRTKENKRK